MSEIKSLERPLRILSIDGGGVRGILPVTWLAYLEKQLPEPLHHYFDLVSGSSIGAVIACAIASGLSAQEIADRWEADAHLTFDRRNRITRPLLNLCAYTGIVPRYQSIGMSSMLTDLFAEQTLGDLKIPALVVTHDPESMAAEVLGSESHAHLPVKEACRASTAAPLFFKPYHLDYQGQRKLLLDGCLSAMNPSVIALSLAINQQTSLSPPDFNEIVLASFGTGKRLPNLRKRGCGPIAQGRSISNALFHGRMTDDHSVSESLLAVDNYFRFQTLLSADLEPMDAPENIPDLQEVADAALEEGMDFHLQRLAKRLQGLPCEQQWVEPVRV